MNTDEILTYFAKQIELELGIVYSAANYFQLQNRLEQIATLRNEGCIEKLFEEAKRGMTPDLKNMLMDLATNNETSFFRDPRIFTAVQNAYLSKLTPRAAPLRIWSAASSSGQEALSIAMTVLEWNERSNVKFGLQIIGSDISGRILDKARAARYSDLEVGRGLSDQMKSKYFEKQIDGGWLAKPLLRERTEFRKINLKEKFSFDGKFDLIFCRNVLIYQSVEAKKEILSRVTETLAPGGFLVLGAGESVYGLSDAYEQVESDGSILYRRKDAFAAAS